MRRGDVVALGPHRLMCGDAGDPRDVRRLFADATPHLVFTSPPYLQQRAYTVAIPCWDTLMQRVFGAMPHHQQTQVLVNLGLVHRDGECLPYWDKWISWMRLREWRCFGLYIWDKLNGMPGDWHGRLAPCFELIFHFNKVALRPNKTQRCKWGEGRHIRASKSYVSREGCRKASDKKSVSNFKIGDSVFRLSPAGASQGVNHPAVFPVALPAAVHDAYSQPGQIVYDPFCGSGTSIVAAEQGGRVCAAMEISAEYCEAAVDRWRRHKAKAIAPLRPKRAPRPPPAAQRTLWAK